MKADMKTFTVAVQWMLAGSFQVEAESLAEAIQKVDDNEPPYDGLPTNGEYLEESFEINTQMTEVENEEK